MALAWRAFRPTFKCFDRNFIWQCTNCNPCFRSKSGIPFRQLHAQWSVLLSHEWYCPEIQSSGDVEVEITDEPFVGTKQEEDIMETILMVHGVHGKKEDMHDLAKALVEQSKCDELYQVVSCDLRGHGESSADDYAEPHTVQSAAGDIVELVSACCLEEGSLPTVVVAAGCPVAHAIALAYLQATLLEGGTTSTISFEASGFGAIPPPRRIYLLQNGLFMSENAVSVAHQEQDKIEDGNNHPLISDLLLSSVNGCQHHTLKNLRFASQHIKSESVLVQHLGVDGSTALWDEGHQESPSNNSRLPCNTNIDTSILVKAICHSSSG
mmetsp:Transcript_13720/g.18043  ORF Transcript_13720/g.18043 Transcript_13720/m.18043 type:complete len:324 (+) Transcript_13720:68-1039(+)